MQILDELYRHIIVRKTADPEVSYTAKLFGRGRKKITQKFGEEAVEVAIEAIDKNKKKTIAESADMLYHLLVLWADMGITPDQVEEEIASRRGISGILEKKTRKKK